MEKPIVFKKPNALAKWIKENKESEIYGKMLTPDFLVIHSKKILNDVVPIGHKSPLNVTLSQLKLPEPDDVQTWWDELCRGDWVEYRVMFSKRFPAACLAKAAIWNSIPEIHLRFSKEEFKEVSEEEFASIVGEAVFKDMEHEFLILSISVRFLNNIDINKKS